MGGSILKNLLKSIDDPNMGRAFSHKLYNQGRLDYNDEYDMLIDNPAFRKWFDGSRGTAMGDTSSKPKLYYHNSDELFDRFKLMDEKPDYRDTGSQGIYFTDNPAGNEYYGGNQYAVHLNMKNPYRLTSQDSFDASYIDDEIMQDLLSRGYDGVEGLGETVVFDPRQISIFSRNGSI